MKLLFQSDDYGFTDAITDGILKGIEKGIIRNTGLFVNMPSSARAAQLIKDKKGISVGIDINLVAGFPLSDPKSVPSLIDENGHFISSVEQMKQKKNPTKGSIMVNFEEDPYPYEEVYIETENQVLKFIELMGRKPDYLHPHSLVTENSEKAAKAIALKYGIVKSFDLLSNSKLYKVPCYWTPKPFSLEAQYETDVEANLLKVLPEALVHGHAVFICHCGYVDNDLLNESTYTMIRTKDLAAATSIKIMEFINKNKIELITYKQLMEDLNVH